MQKEQAVQIVSRLEEGFEKQLELYAKLKQLSEAQSAALREGNRERAAEIIRERTPLIEHLSALDRELAEERGQWAQIEELLSEEQRKKVGQQVERIQQVIESILEKDDETRMALKGWEAEANEQRAKMNKVRAATQAYGKQTGESNEGGDSLLFDRRE